MQSVKSHLFHDETLPSFFRRLAWSPDGSFLLVPAGIDLNAWSNLLCTNVVLYFFSGCWLPKNSGSGQNLMLLFGCFMVLSLTPWSLLSLTRVNVNNNLSYWDVHLMHHLVDGCDPH